MKRYGKDFSFNDNAELWVTVVNYMDDIVRENIHGDVAPCEPDEFLAAYIRQDPDFVDLLNDEFNITDIEIINPINHEALETAKQIRRSDKWDNDLNRQLCELAGLGNEYDSADGETFEDVVFKAADILGVYIV